MESPQTSNKDFEVTGVSRSGRVRKKSSKLIDFRSPDDVEKKPKRVGRPGRPSGTGRVGRPPTRGRKPIPRQITLDDAADDDAAVADDDDDDVKDFSNDAIDDWNLSANEEIDRNTTTKVTTNTTIAADSEDEINELVADLVEGVEAESLEIANNSIESKVRQSLYMTEKSNKRKILKDGKVITSKLERKDKGKTRFTAYSLWAREFRKSNKFNKFQELDFASTARRLGELWANVSNKEKNTWRRKAKIQATKTRARDRYEQKNSKEIGTKTTNSNNSIYVNRATTSRTKKLAAEKEKTPPPSPQLTQASPIATPTNAQQSTRTSTPIQRRNETKSTRRRNNSMRSNTTNSPVTDSPSNHRINDISKSTAAYNASALLSATTTTTNSITSHANRKTILPNIEPIDAAAHLKLLGESLSVIGERLKEHDGQVAVAGSLSVLLDSLLCSLGPLMCLAKHIPGMEKRQQLCENLASTLDNIAYVMPGL